MAPELSEDVAEKLAVLGEPEAEFTVAHRRLMLVAILAPLIELVGLVLLVAPFVLFKVRWIAFGEHFMQTFGILLLVFPIAFLVRAWRNWGVHVVVYPEGLIRLRGDEASAFRWEEVASVCAMKPEGHLAWAYKGTYQVVVKKYSGQEIHFDDQIGHVKRLGEIIQRRTLPRLLQQALDACEAGAVVDFGKIRVSRSKLFHDKYIAPWSEVKEVVNNGYTVMARGAKWLKSVSLSEVPNAHVLMALVDQYLALKEPVR